MPVDTSISSTPPMPFFLSSENIAVVSSWTAAVDAIKHAYSIPFNDAMVPPRAMARGDGFWLRSLSAVSPSGQYHGCKLISASPKLGRVSYLIALFSQETMDLAALMDGQQITEIRTAATSAVAVERLAPARPLTLALLGSGAVAKSHLRAISATCELADVRVFSPTPASRQRFADAFMAEGINIKAVETPEAAVSRADVVICAARSRDETPVFLGDWLEPGMMVVSIGSTLPEQREVDVETLRLADLIVADMPDEVLNETGDALAARDAGLEVGTITIGLAELMSGQSAGRSSPDDIVVFKSVGSALQDIVTAEMLLNCAIERGLYSKLNQNIATVLK